MSRFFRDFERGALLEEVILVFASEAESERALCASTKVLVAINIGGRAAAWLGAVAHVLHAGNAHIEGELIKFVNDILINAYICEVTLCHECLAAFHARAEELAHLTSHDEISSIVAKALLTEEVKAVRKEKEVF